MNAETVPAPATPAQRERLWGLAVKVRRTVPRHLTAAQAEALIAEFEQLPRSGPLPGESMTRKLERDRRERNR
jgi:hypothetical protein